MHIHTRSGSIDRACTYTVWQHRPCLYIHGVAASTVPVHIVAVMTMHVHAKGVACETSMYMSLLHVLCWTSYAWQFALRFLGLAALTSLFLDASLVVSGLLPRNTWPHRQASFLFNIGLATTVRTRLKYWEGILVQIP